MIRSIRFISPVTSFLSFFFWWLLPFSFSSFVGLYLSLSQSFCIFLKVSIILSRIIYASLICSVNFCISSVLLDSKYLLNFSNNINQLDSRKTPNELFKEYKIETSFLKKIIAYNGAHITNEYELDFPSTTFIENLKLCLPSFVGMTYNTFRSPLQSFLDPHCSFYSILSNATHLQGEIMDINQGEKIQASTHKIIRIFGSLSFL